MLSSRAFKQKAAQQIAGTEQNQIGELYLLLRLKWEARVPVAIQIMGKGMSVSRYSYNSSAQLVS